MLHLLAEEQLPQGMSDVLVLPLVLTLAGLGIFYFGWYVENRLTKAPWKWLALVPVLIGMFIGWSPFSRWAFEVGYQEAVGTGAYKRMLAAHWGAFFIPVLGLVLIILFHFFNQRLNLAPED